MTTQAQIEANRLNAQKSTGPVTPEGKTIASQNALKHGLLARRFLIDGTERGEFDRFRLRLLADLKPVGFMETVLADRIATLVWRLRRSARLQNGAVNVMAEKAKKQLDMLYQPPMFETPQEGEDYLVGTTAVNDFTNNKILDRMAAYEYRIERSLFAAQKEFQRLQYLHAKHNAEENDAPKNTVFEQTNPISENEKSVSKAFSKSY
jgi:hypothetical protein